MDQKEAERIHVLTRDTFYQAYDALEQALPAPKRGDPDDKERRDNRAISEVAGLIPVTAAEVKLAVLFVASSAHAESILGTVAKVEDPDKPRVKAVSMMRQGFVALSLMMRLQAARQKRDANNALADSAAWTEHFALEFMMEARARSGRGGTAAETAPAVSPPETVSDFVDIETDVRQSDEVLAPESTPASETMSPANASGFETPRRFASNETLMRGAIPDPGLPDGLARPLPEALAAPLPG